jgi:hypothetical protein
MALLRKSSSLPENGGIMEDTDCGQARFVAQTEFSLFAGKL